MEDPKQNPENKGKKLDTSAIAKNIAEKYL